VVVRVSISSLMGGAGQAVAHGRPDPRVDQARSVEKTEVGQHLAGQARVAHDVGRPGAEEGRWLACDGISALINPRIYRDRPPRRSRSLKAARCG
jgi:hypothetical protein